MTRGGMRECHVEAERATRGGSSKAIKNCASDVRPGSEDLPSDAHAGSSLSPLRMRLAMVRVTVEPDTAALLMVAPVLATCT